MTANDGDPQEANSTVTLEIPGEISMMQLHGCGVRCINPDPAASILARLH